MDAQQVKQALQINQTVLNDLRQQWLQLMDASVWHQLSFEKIGLSARMRKRLLETAEALVQMTSSKDWIPQPREQLKSALGSSLKLRDSLTALERTVSELKPDNDGQQFGQDVILFRQALIEFIEPLEYCWAEILEAQLDQSDDDIE